MMRESHSRDLPARSFKLNRRCYLQLERLEARETPAITLSASAIWQDLGPNVIQNGQTVNIPNNPVIGALDAVYVDPTNPNIIFVGGTNGGVWRTLNGTAANPVWAPLTDTLPSLSVTDISIDPSNSNRVLVGIGGSADGGYREQTYRDPSGNIRPIPGSGIIRGDLVGPLFSTNALAASPNWQVLNALAGQDIRKVFIRANFMLVGTNTGVYRSVNEGATFTQVLTGNVFDLAEDPGNPNRFYAAVRNGAAAPQVWRTDSGGASGSWGDVSDPLMRLNATTVNVKLTVFNQSAINDVVYVAVANDNPPPSDTQVVNLNPAGTLAWPTHGSGRGAFLASVVWSTNQGGVWTQMDTPRYLGVPQAIGPLSLGGRINAGVVTTVDRHRLQTGDQVFIKNADNDTGDTNPPIFFNGNNNAIDQNTGQFITPELWNVTVVDETTFEISDTFGGAAFATGDTNPDGTNGTFQILESLNIGERGEFLEIVADPTNPAAVYIAGALPYYPSSEVAGNPQVTQSTYTANIWRGDRTQPANGSNFYTSSQWAPISYNTGPATSKNPGAAFQSGLGGIPGWWTNGTYTIDGSAPPADPREMIFDNNGQLLLANSGGLYRQTAPDSNTGGWASVNGNLGVAQVWSVAWDQLNQQAFAGFQDTAAADQSASGSKVYTTDFSIPGLITTFDVLNAFLDQANFYTVQVDNSNLTANPNDPVVANRNLTVRYYVGNNFGIVARKVFNANGTQVGDTTFLTFAGPATPFNAFSGLVGTDLGNWQGENQPIEMKLNVNDPRRGMYGTTELYEDSDPIDEQGNVVNRVTPAGMAGRVRSIIYGGKRGQQTFNQVAYVGTTTGQLWRRGEFGVTFNNLNVPGGTASIEDLAVDPDDWRHIYVLKGNRIYETTNGDSNNPLWRDVTFNLVGPPTGDGTAGENFLTTELQSIAVWDGTPNDTTGGVTLVAGGRGGVYRLLFDPTCDLNVWTEYGEGLPNTVVQDIQIYGDRMVIGTFGRGIWTIPDVRSTLPFGATLIVTGDAGANTMSITADPTNPNAAIVNDGLGNTRSLIFGEFGRIQFNGQGGADTIIIGSNGLAPNSTLQFIRYLIEVNAGGDVGDTIIINGQGQGSTRATVTPTSVGYNPGYDNLFGACGYVSFTGMNQGSVQVYTGLGADTLLVLNGALPQVTNLVGGGGNDQYILGGGGSNGTVAITDSSGNDSITMYGSNAVDTMFMTQGGMWTGSFVALFDQNQIETATVNGLGAVDTFVRYGTTGNDNFIARQYTPNSGHVAGLPGTFTFYQDIEDLVVDGNGGTDNLLWEDRTNTTFGTAINPAAGMVYKPTGTYSGEFRTGNATFNTPLTTLRFFSLTGSFSANGDPDASGDRDVLSVLGVTTNTIGASLGETQAVDGSDSVFATDTIVSISNTSLGQLAPIFLGASTDTLLSFSTVYVRSGDESGTGDSIYAVPSLRTNLLIDGGLPSGGTGDTLTVGVAGPRTLTTSIDPAFGPIHKRVTQVVNSASVGYFNIETAATVDTSTPGPGPSPPPTPVSTQLFVASTDAGVPVQVRAYNSSTGTLLYGGPITPFGGFGGGATVATGDVTGDGNQDFAVAAGPGGGPQVIIYDGTTGKQIYSFFAFESNFRGGVNVALADVNGDGFEDIIAGAGAGGGPRVRVISGVDRSVLHDFFVFEPTFTGGVRVSGGDLTGDGMADLVVGTLSQADRVRVIRMPDRAVLSEFRAYGGFGGGVNVAAGDITGDGIADIITGAGDGGGPHVKVFNGVGNGEIRSFFVNDTTSPGQQPIALSGGVRVAAVDQDGDGLTDVLTGLGRGARPLAQIFRVSQFSGGTVGATLTPLLAINTFGNTYGNGIFVG